MVFAADEIVAARVFPPRAPPPPPLLPVFLRILLLCLGVLPLGLSSRPVKPEIGDKGVLIDAGLVGLFTIPAPALGLADKSELKPVFSRDEKGGARITYPNGFAIDVSVAPD